MLWPVDQINLVIHHCRSLYSDLRVCSPICIRQSGRVHLRAERCRFVSERAVRTQSHRGSPVGPGGGDIYILARKWKSSCLSGWKPGGLCNCFILWSTALATGQPPTPTPRSCTPKHLHLPGMGTPPLCCTARSRIVVVLVLVVVDGP